ncbi:MAG TPA: hypothetical protein VFT66_03435 [Roseiflexaceae bacterium]|nr:hypothetical protein [Roseiflexaceae bacterium]
MSRDEGKFPLWLAGVLIAVFLIAIGRFVSGPGNPVLVQQFAPRPTDPNAPTVESWQLPQVHLPSLPPAVQRRITDLRDRFGGGEAVPALTPVATGPRVRVEVTQVRRQGEQAEVRGTITNISDQPLTIPANAFSFRDSAGTTYAIEGSSSTELQPNQSTDLSLSVPLPAGRGLTLILNLSPDPPLEQVLLVEPVTPTDAAIP